MKIDFIYRIVWYYTITSRKWLAIVVDNYCLCRTLNPAVISLLLRTSLQIIDRHCVADRKNIGKVILLPLLTVASLNFITSAAWDHLPGILGSRSEGEGWKWGTGNPPQKRGSFSALRNFNFLFPCKLLELEMSLGPKVYYKRGLDVLWH